MIVAHRTPSDTAQRERDVDRVLEFYKSFESEGVSRLDAAVSPDWEIDPVAPGAAPGRAGYAPILRAFNAAFPDNVVTIEDAFGAGGRVVVRSTMRATHRAPFLNIAATQKAIVLRTCDIHEVRGDLIARSWHIEDFFGFLAQVGALG